MIFNFGKITSLRSSISSRNQSQIRWILIPWNRLEVFFHNLSFSPIYIIDSSSDLIKIEEIIKDFLNSLWIRPLFTIIHLNSRYFHQIGKFGLCFDSWPCAIDDHSVFFRQCTSFSFLHFPFLHAFICSSSQHFSLSALFLFSLPHFSQREKGE